MRPTTMKSQALNASNGNYAAESSATEGRMSPCTTGGGFTSGSARLLGGAVFVDLFLGGEPVVELLAGGEAAALRAPVGRFWRFVLRDFPRTMESHAAPGARR